MSISPTQTDAISQPNLDGIYTPLAEAGEELQRRWRVDSLKRRMDAYLGTDVPEFLRERPKAWLARNVATPNHEFHRFADLAASAGLSCAVAEFHDDKFDPGNVCKYHLARIYGCRGTSRNGEPIYESHTIVDFNRFNGKKIRDVRTLWDTSLIRFHRDLMAKAAGNLSHEVFDFSDWTGRNGNNPSEFYPRFLALFLRNAILFENFLLTAEEEAFTRKIVMPSIEAIIGEFGCNPLIVRLAPKETENDRHWNCYPAEVAAHLDSLLPGKPRTRA